MKKILWPLSVALAIFLIRAFAPEQAIPAEHAEPSKLDSKHEPTDHFFLQRSYPDKQFDLRAYESALSEVRSRATHKVTSNSIQNTPWTQEGPTNIGGRINAIAIDPNNSSIILVGCASGGIFKSTNSGQSWTPIFDDATSLAIGDITFEPGNSNVIYAGTGDPNISGYPFIGDGIYKSTDGGATWTNKGLTDQRIISRIVVDPQNTNKIYVGTMGLPMQRDNNRGLYVSTDGGNSWSQSLFVANQAGIIDLQMHPTNSQVLYASSWDRIRSNQESTVYGTNAKVWKTTDGGGNWSQLTGGLPTSAMSRVNLSIDASSPSTVYACYVDSTYNTYGIYKTTNSGTSWAPIDISSLDPWALGGFGWYFGNIFVNPYQSSHIYLLGVQLWRTTNNGTTWDQVDPDWWTYDVHADKHDLVFTGANSFYLATDGGLYYTTNNGSTWTDAEDIPNSQFYRIKPNPHQSGLYVGGMQDNGTASGNAATINNWSRIYGGDGFQPLFTSNPQEMVAESQNGGLAYTDDGGFSFYDFTFGIDELDRRNWDMPVMVSNFNSGTFYTGTYRVYKTSGGLASHFWNPISNDLTDGIIFGSRYHTISTVEESPLSQTTLYAGTSDGNVHRSTNGGTNWTSISNGVPKRYVTSVKASPHDQNEVFVTVSGYKYNDFFPHILRSTDKGTTWNSIAGDLPQLAINDMLPHPTRDSVYVAASDGGVYVTQNFGVNWQRVGTGMPICPVYDLEWDLPNNKLIAGTFARSMMSFPMDSLVEDIFIGVDPGQSAQQLRLYPNPASEAIQMDMGNANAEWEIIDLTGKVVMEGSYAQSLQSIRISGIKAGVYFLKAKTGENVQVERFIKQ